MTRTVNAPVLPSVAVADGARGTLSSFPLAPAGDVAPSFALGGANGLVRPAGVVVDATGRTYATSSNTNADQEFGAGAGAQPDQAISGAQTGLTFPAAVALGAADGLYVTSPPAQSVSYFAPGTSGNVAPLRTISGPDTGLGDAEGMTVNPRGDLSVANADLNTLTEYPPGASGDVAPIATVNSPNHLYGAPRDRAGRAGAPAGDAALPAGDRALPRQRRQHLDPGTSPNPTPG